MMFDSEMRGSFYNSAKRGQPEHSKEFSNIFDDSGCTEQSKHSIESSNIFNDDGSNKISKPAATSDIGDNHNTDDHDTIACVTAET